MMPLKALKSLMTGLLAITAVTAAVGPSFPSDHQTTEPENNSQSESYAVDENIETIEGIRESSSQLGEQPTLVKSLGSEIEETGNSELEVLDIRPAAMIAPLETSVAKTTQTEEEAAKLTSVKTKKVTVRWKNLDTSINKKNAHTGATGTLVYEAPEGASGTVHLYLSRQKPGKATWESVATFFVPKHTKHHSQSFRDGNQKLSSGSVKYRVTAKSAATGTKVTLPADFTVSYNKSATKVTASTLKGKTLTTDSLYPFQASGKLTGSSTRQMFIQKYNVKKKTWINVVSKSVAPNKTFHINMPSTKYNEHYRLYAPADLSHAAYYGPSTFVKRTSPKAFIQSAYIKKKTIVPWEANKGQVFVSMRLVGGESQPTITLQEQVNGKWRNIKSTKGRGYASFTFPKGSVHSKSATKRYRYAVSSSTYSRGAASATFTVKWDNPRFYTGKKLTAYNYSKKYCPNMTIEYKRLPSNVWGLATLGTDITALSTSVPARHLRTVALHECAHHRQWQLYGSNWDSFETKMNKSYKARGSMGVEHNAECIANTWHRNSYWAYGKKCSGQQAKDAQRMASGRKI